MASPMTSLAIYFTHLSTKRPSKTSMYLKRGVQALSPNINKKAFQNIYVSQKWSSNLRHQILTQRF
ncbi:hypothetical protein RHMOL_Rhmol01G0262300 [Rhododendron molle]|uniref:Uncharacterized protein n=1 Tax=Rhododendron molle TaxID=49168 RepID=A0ACC0Q727_RHOML|nr:hypothetical protein RHMOL_Rhmol01G0262300 [Rhododendron molle]